MLDYCKVDFKSLKVDGIDTKDYPDFCDAYICDGYYLDGTPLSDDDLDELSQDGHLVYELVYNKLY
jgi:hypothetical protein